jgi:hypothetical protein
VFADFSCSANERVSSSSALALAGERSSVRQDSDKRVHGRYWEGALSKAKPFTGTIRNIALAPNQVISYISSDADDNASSLMSDDVKNSMLTAAQLRGARGLLNWSGKRLAQESGVSLPTIRRAEPNDGPLRMIPANARAIRTTLEAAGIQFIPENGGGPGVRLGKSPAVKRVRSR